MAIGDSYLSFEEFKARTRSTTVGNDAAIQAVLKSASQSIEGHCGRQFNKSEEDEIRYFDVPYGTRWWGGADYTGRGFWGPNPLELGDVVSITEIASDDGTGSYATAWEDSDFLLYPRNQAAKGLPYREVRRAPLGTWHLTAYPVRVTGIFGWPDIPAPVKEVTFLMANRLKSLWDAPFGASGSTNPEMGGLEMTNSITPLLKQMLKPYVVRTV